MKKTFTNKEARAIGDKLKINWKKILLREFKAGLIVELEHGLVDKHTNVTNDNPIKTGKIALAHLNESSTYYTALHEMENRMSVPTKEQIKKALLKLLMEKAVRVKPGLKQRPAKQSAKKQKPTHGRVVSYTTKTPGGGPASKIKEKKKKAKKVKAKQLKNKG